MMIARRLGWLAATLTAFAGGLAFGSSAAFAVGLLLVLLPLLSLPLNLFLRRRLVPTLEGGGSLRKGGEGSLRILVENPTLLPVFCVRCRVQAENQLCGQSARRSLLLWLPPRRLSCSELRFQSDWCGRLRLQLLDITLYDCFGLLGVPLKSEEHRYVTVQPDTFDMSLSLRPSSTESDESESYSDYRVGQDLTEIFQIREYADGDSPRQIHWKLSSKLDRLIVKDPSLPILRSVMVLWERSGGSGRVERTDAQAEVAVTLCRTLLEAGMQFTLAWNDTERQLLAQREVRDMEELIGVIPQLLRAAGRKDAVSAAELLLQSGQRLPARILYIAEEPHSAVVELENHSVVTPLLCGEGTAKNALHFDAEHYSAQLMKIEI